MVTLIDHFNWRKVEKEKGNCRFLAWAVWEHHLWEEGTQKKNPDVNCLSETASFESESKVTLMII